MPQPALRTLLVADDPASWEAAGFGVTRSAPGPQANEVGDVWIGEIRIRLLGRSATDHDRRGIVAWEFDGVDDGAIDGITTIAAAQPLVVPDHAPHANGTVSMDHVVMISPDLDRTISALEANGFEARRVRDVPGSDPLRRQVFFWAGPTIIELVGPAEPTGSGPSTLWGLALSSADLDGAVEVLGDRLGRVKDAVQTGRRIATIKTRDLDIGTAIALMTPHREQDADSSNASGPTTAEPAGNNKAPGRA